MPERALTSFAMCHAYRYFADEVLVIDVTKLDTHRIFITNG